MSGINEKTLPQEVEKMLESLPEEKRDAARTQFLSMSPDQLKQVIEKMGTMSPEEREAMKKQRASMTPEQLADLSKQEEKRKAMQEKMLTMGAGKGKRKASNFKVSFVRLLSYFAKKKARFVTVIIAAVFATGLTIAAPYIIAQALNIFEDHVVNKTPFNYQKVTVIVFWLGIIYIVNLVLSLYQNRTMTSITQDTVYELRKEVDHKLMRLPFNYFDSKQKGDILSRITNDIDNIALSMQQSIVQIVSSTLTVIGCLVMMFILSWYITLGCLAFLGIGLLVSKKIMEKSQVYFKEQWQNLGDLNVVVEETFSGMNVVKVFGREDKKLEEFDKSNEAMYQTSRKAQFFSGIINPASGLFNNLAYVFICVVSGFSFIHGGISLGSITALIQYQKQYSSPVTQMASLINTLQSAVASAERVFELLDEAEEVETSDNYRKLENVEGNIEFSHLQFGYTPDKLLMKDIDVNVKKGQMVAIVGPTGAGKTTLVNLLMRFYEPNGGKIMIDGMNIRDMTRHDLRDIFGMVLQDTWLYSGTIFENIAYGNKNASREQVIEAARSAQVEFFFETMPDGYDTMINEEASNISQGQKQLLTIARAMVADPKILILDEATSSVDTRTELLIQKAMNNLLKGRTSFVIAHRLSTIKDADLILYMEQGNIVEQGTHESLMEKGGKYADLYNSQFASKEEEFKGFHYMDFKSNVSAVIDEMLNAYSKEKGVEVKHTMVLDNMQYEKDLFAQLRGDNPPVVFRGRGPMMQKSEEYQALCEPLNDTKAAKELLSDSFAVVSKDGKICGLPFSVEALGLVYNEKITEKYFALPNKAVDINDMQEIKSFDMLKAVVEDMSAHKDELGIKGVFPTCAFAKNSEHQWKTHPNIY